MGWIVVLNRQSSTERKKSPNPLWQRFRGFFISGENFRKL
jgi:hypothetical protein